MTPRLMVWASDSVVRQFSNWMRGMRTSEPTPESMLLGLYSLIREVRKEVGRGASTLTPRELLGVFITDVDKLGLDSHSAGA